MFVKEISVALGFPRRGPDLGLITEGDNVKLSHAQLGWKGRDSCRIVNKGSNPDASQQLMGFPSHHLPSKCEADQQTPISFRTIWTSPFRPPTKDPKSDELDTGQSDRSCREQTQQVPL